MIIILCLYLVALWAALFNYLTLSGRVTMTGRVVEVTPNVTGQIVAIPVKPNVPVKANDVSFQIDLVHHRERDHAGWNVFAERLSDHQKARRSISFSITLRGASITPGSSRSRRASGQGQIAVSGTLARTNALGGVAVFPTVISIPDGMSHDSIRLGMSGSATAFAGNAGVSGLLVSILVGVSSYAAHLWPARRKMVRMREKKRASLDGAARFR